MGFLDKKSYNEAAQGFAKKYQNHPDAKVYEGLWGGRGQYQGKLQRIITYDGKIVIVNMESGQVIDFYTGNNYTGLYNLKPLR